MESTTPKLNLFDLKKENEENMIFFPENKNEDINEEDKANNKSKYKIDYPTILKEIIERTNKRESYVNEYYCNLLLMLEEAEIQYKLSAFSCLTYCYQLNENSESIYSIANKFEKKYMNNINKDTNEYFMKVFCRAAYFFQKDKNCFYACKYINKCVEIITKYKPSEQRAAQILNYQTNMENDLQNYIQKKKLLFNDEKFLQEKGKAIKELIDSIITSNNKIDIKESSSDNDNFNYLFLINKKWIINAHKFISSFLSTRGDNSVHNKKLIEETFEKDYVFSNYFNQENKNGALPAYPGPIDNIPMTSFKDHWEDFKNEDENYFVKKDLKLNEDYILVNGEDWDLLKNVFGATNEIKRKKNNLDLIDIKYILFDKRLRKYDEFFPHVKQRYIQINSNSTIKQLKYKILNCINNYLKYIYESQNKIYKESKQDLLFSILNKEDKAILFEISLAFFLRVDFFESINIERLELEENSNVNELFEKFDKKRHILIVEACKTDNLPFLVDLKYQNENKLVCSICNKEIKKMENKYKCICHYSIFCSKECSNNSDTHIKLEKKIKELSIEEFGLSNLFDFKLSSILQNSRNNGRVGINNLGNNSYMNSVLQCLSKNEDLTKYFLKKFYKLDKINSSNQDSNESFINCYFDFINYLFNGHNELDPTNFMNAFFIKSKLQKTNEELDPYEFLVSLLNILHKELNRGNDKVEMKKEECFKKDKETDIQASRRILRYKKIKNDSIILDLFKGQFKSTIICGKCQKSSFFFDNFLSLELPIPSKKSQFQFKLFTNEEKYMTFNSKVKETTLMSDIILKSISKIKKSNYFEYLKTTKIDNNLFNYNVVEVPNNILYNNIQVIEFNKAYLITNIYNTNYLDINKKNIKSIDNLRYIEYCKQRKNYELVLYEKNINSLDGNYIDIFVYPVAELEKESMFMMNMVKYDLILSYPIMISIRKNDTLKDLQITIFNKMSKLLHSQFQSYYDSIDICFPHFTDKWENLKIKEGKCPICGKAYDRNTNYCSLLNPSINKSIKISNLIEKIGKGRPLILIAKSAEYVEDRSLFKGLKLFKEKRNEIDSRSNITIYDAFDLLYDGDNDSVNESFCNKCKKNQKSLIKKEISKPPLYLIIKFNRFKNRGNSRKININETQILFNLYFDIKDYLIFPDTDNSEYNLYGVVYYKRSFNSNHYYSYCSSFGRWFSYNDTYLEEPNALESKGAYILFYKRKNFD